MFAAPGISSDRVALTITEKVRFTTLLVLKDSLTANTAESTEDRCMHDTHIFDSGGSSKRGSYTR